MTTTLHIVFLIGVACGVWVGRRLAERARARFDMRKTWDGRAAYRKS